MGGLPTESPGQRSPWTETPLWTETLWTVFGRVFVHGCLERGIYPDLVKEQTDHRSNAMMLYKKSDMKLKKQMSDMFSVLSKKLRKLDPVRIECMKKRPNQNIKQ